LKGLGEEKGLAGGGESSPNEDPGGKEGYTRKTLDSTRPTRGRKNKADAGAKQAESPMTEESISAKGEILDDRGKGRGVTGGESSHDSGRGVVNFDERHRAPGRKLRELERK